MHDTSKYSELVTALAVIFMVVFNEEPYDYWDTYLGMLGLALSYFYFQNIRKYNWFYQFLTFSLTSVSFVIILFSFCGVSAKENNKLVTYLDFGEYKIGEFWPFLVLTIILFLFHLFSTHSPKPNEN